MERPKLTISMITREAIDSLDRMTAFQEEVARLERANDTEGLQRLKAEAQAEAKEWRRVRLENDTEGFRRLLEKSNKRYKRLGYKKRKW